MATFYENELPVLGWRALHTKKPAEDTRPFIGMLIFLVLAFCIPILAWAESSSVEVPVVNRMISAGSILSADDITMRTLEKRFLHPRMITDKQDLLDKEAIRTLRSGHPVYSTNVRVPPKVRKNTVIEVEYVAPALTLRGTGKVLEDGGVGDTIRIINPESGKVMAGVVQPNGEVVVR